MTPSQSLRVLVVDDSANLRHVIKRYLETSYDALEFFEAGNGEEALTVLQEQAVFDQPIDVIFLDWMMPKISGLEFLQQMRAILQFKENPKVIMLTAETYSDQMNAVMKYNVSAYVTKPFTQEDLRAVMNRIFKEGELKHAV